MGLAHDLVVTGDTIVVGFPVLVKGKEGVLTTQVQVLRFGTG